jgi:hypothetical protein
MSGVESRARKWLAIRNGRILRKDGDYGLICLFRLGVVDG